MRKKCLQSFFLLLLLNGTTFTVLGYFYSKSTLSNTQTGEAAIIATACCVDAVLGCTPPNKTSTSIFYRETHWLKPGREGAKLISGSPYILDIHLK